MNPSRSPQTWSIMPETLIQTVNVLFFELKSNQTSDLKSDPYENSELEIQSLKRSQKSDLSEMNVYDFLNKCDEFISQHSLQGINSVKKSSVNLLQGSFEEELSISCSQCKHHLLKELQSTKEKMRLERIVDQLEITIKEMRQITESQKDRQLQRQIFLQKVKYQNLKIQSSVFSLSIKEQRELDLGIQCPCSQTTSIIQSQQSEAQIVTENQLQLLLKSIKTFDEKLTEKETENKYLKIQNRSLLKTKSEIQNMKKEINKTKSERDMFKKKLISLAEKQTKPIEKRHEIQTEKNIRAGLKERGLQAKKKNDSLFELSLTDTSPIIVSKNSPSQIGKQFKKQQRINFIQPLNKQI